MESFEEETVALRMKCATLEQKENDARIKLEMFIKDKEDLKKKLD
jgi:hypothetical protein